MSTPFAFPVFLEVRGRRCLVVGGGPEAAEKAGALAALGACVVVSDPEPRRTGSLAGLPNVELRTGPFDPDLLAGAFLVVVASEDRVERRRIAGLAREAGALVNAVDELDLCDWSAPAILRRGRLTVAVGTGGVSPALAVRLRDRLAGELGDEHGELLELFAEVRSRIQASGRPTGTRRALWYALVDGPVLDLLRDGDRASARAALKAAIAAWEAGA